uniref:coiled-coil domain-containing protein 146-like n=1 Tax=Oncorhynchus gorbuscha TaxID=8017 RepID=UPI001EAF6AD0|nr:coiled-coil domain-containing protein 146-like [Oncorhynchus gorbuscha]
MRQSHRHREELHTLSCLTQIKADEREQKSRDRHRAEQRYHRIKQELRGKSLVIHELKKQNQEVQSRLGVFAKLYDNIKGDRNKCMNLIQMASQRTAEMREKFKILDNEIEILRTNAINKEKLLQKSRLKHFHSHTIRDSLRNDISKVTLVLHEMRQKREEQKLNLGRLTHMINYHEKNLLQMRKSHDNAVQSRNDRGVQLLEREEEMCIFYEKVNVQEGLIRDGNIEMQALEEETRCLQMITKEEGRQTALSRKLVPCQRRLKGESTMLQIQLSECKERMLELEKALEDPGQENRARELEGNDPSPVELIQKIEQLEVGLAEREELLLEKDLVFEQVTRISQRIRAKAENGKQDTLQLAKKVNELQGRIKESTRRMMAVVSELSMRQASAMTLQQELKERELFLDTCHRRLDQGLPPSEDLEQEWQHILRDEQRRQADQQEKDRLVEEEERSQLPSGVYTTAEARPNAYIPLGDTLPLPKPYGALAPFKPSEPGTNIRHIRKPEPKPIEI